MIEYHAGMRLEDGWILLSCIGSEFGLSEVMAAKDEDGIGVVAIWKRVAGQDHRLTDEWDVWAVDTEDGRRVHSYDIDGGDTVPLTPPAVVTT